MRAPPAPRDARPAPRRPSSGAPATSANTVAAATLCACALLAGCSAAAPPPPTGPALDAERIAVVLERATRLEEPERVLFEWSLEERDLRARGRGVARAEPPYRARLDLFLANGETVAQAALVRGDMRLPRGAPRGIIPPPDMLWATFGVFRPGDDAALLGADEPEPGRVRLRYGFPGGEELHYRIADNRILSVERVRDGSVVERVVLEPGTTERAPASARYRDMAAFRELVLTRESVEYVEPYPPDIWGIR